MKKPDHCKKQGKTTYCKITDCWNCSWVGMSMAEARKKFPKPVELVKHSPLPWKAKPKKWAYFDMAGNIPLCSNGDMAVLVAQGHPKDRHLANSIAKVNARFAELACNSYYSLVTNIQDLLDICKECDAEGSLTKKMKDVIVKIEKKQNKHSRRR